MIQIAFCVSLLMSDFGALRDAHPAVIEQFEQRTLETEAGPIDYRLYVPRLEKDATVHEVPRKRSHGLLVWLHGIGEAGDNNVDQLAWLESFDWNAWSARAFVLAVQCPSELASWYRATRAIQTPDGLDRLERVYQHVIEQHPIDRNQIWLAGISQGASACWEYASRHPRRFAAVVPMSTHSTRDDWCSRILQADRSGHCAVWAFQTTGDGRAQIQWCEQIIAKLGRHGFSGRLTVIDSPSHNSWTPAFTTHRLTRWLAARDRSIPTRWKPTVAEFTRRTRPIDAETSFVAALCVVVTLGAVGSVIRCWKRNRVQKSVLDKRTQSRP